MPFSSQAQWKKCFASGNPGWDCRKWAHETAGGKGRRFRRLPIKKKSYTLAEFTAIALKEASDPVAVALASLYTPELLTLKSTQIAPGVSRIRGDLCNIHGRWGSCRAAGFGGAATPSKRVAPKKLPNAPKPKAGGGKRAAGGKKGGAGTAAKPKPTPEQRAAQRQEEQAKQREANRQSVIDEMAAGDVGLQPAAAKALLGFADGTEDPAYTDGLISAGLMERGRDGTPRLTSAGHAAVNAINHGNTRSALDAIGRGADRKVGQEERATASAERKRAADERHAAVEAKRAEAERKRAERLAKQGKGGGGKGKKPAQPKPVRAPAPRTSAPPHVVGGGGGSRGAPQPKPKAPALSQALVDAAQALSDGREMDDATVNLLIRNGLARRNREGDLILTAAGQRATKKEQAVTKAEALTKLKRLYVSEGMEVPKEKAARSAISREITKSVTGRILEAQQGQAAYSPASSVVVMSCTPDVIRQPHDGQTPPLVSTVLHSTARSLVSEKDNGALPRRPSRPVQTGPGGASRGDASVAQRGKSWGSTDIRASVPDVAGAQTGTRYVRPHMPDVPPDPYSTTSFAVFKDASGAYRWIARTTTAYRDRDGEIISVKALEADAARMTATGQYGPLRYWHVGQPDPLSVDAPWGPGLDIGTCDFSTVIGRTSLESGIFKSEALGRAFADTAADHELSPGFFHAITEPDAATGVFDHIRRFERSVVPIQHGRASNLFTGLTVKEHRMDKETYDKRVKAYLDFARTQGIAPEAAAAPIMAMEQADKEAAELHIAHKEEKPRVLDMFRAFFTGEQAATKEEATEEAAPVVEASVAAAAEPEQPPPDPLATLKEELAGLRAEIASLKAPMDMMVDEETPAETVGEGGMEEPGEPDGDGGLTLSTDDLAAIGQMFGGVLSSALEPLIGALGITQKLDTHMGELKSLMGGYVKQKEAGDTERADQVAALKATIDQQQAAITESQAKLTELMGDQPRNTGYRPTQAADNGAEALRAAIKDGPDGTAGSGPFDDIVANLFPGLAQGGK